MRLAWVPVVAISCVPATPPVSLAEGATPERPRIVGEVLSEGSVRERLAPVDDADLVILYGGEQMGSLETCGCPKRPRGSLARVEGYRAAMRARQPDVPDLLLAAGNWLDDTIGTDDALREDVRIANRWMVDGLAAGDWGYLNVGFRDLPGLVEAGALPAGVVSANVRPPDGTPGPALWTVHQAGDLRVAVTGVSSLGMSFSQPKGWTYLDELAALREVLPRMQAEADLVVVMAYHPGRKATPIAELPGIDVLIEAGEFEEGYAPALEGETVWVRSHVQTMRLGELRLVVRDGRVIAAVDRKIDLDDAIPSDPRIAAMTKDARAEIDAAQQALFGTW